MAFDTIIDKTKLESALTASANAIREKTGGTEPIAWLPDKGFAEAIGAIETGGGGSADEGWIKDGNTHVWISLQEGRTSPMLGVCPNGTVTVDWGDGTTPDVLTGTSTSSVKWTPTHNYAEPGDYVITLTVDGEMGLYGVSITNQRSGILRYANTTDPRNRTYQTAVRKVEIGNKVTLRSYAFCTCDSLTSVFIPEGVTSIGANAFSGCNSLTSVVIPNGLTSIETGAFYSCYSLTSVFIPEEVTSIASEAFGQCYSLTSVFIPEGVTSIASNAFYRCYALANIVIPKSVTSVKYAAFSECYGVRYYDFTACVAVPSLGSTDAFKGISDDCEIRVPAALYDKWIAATNWATYASYIKAV